MSTRRTSSPYIAVRRTTALARSGEAAQRSRLEAQDMVGQEEAAQLLGVVPEVIESRVANGELLGLQHPGLGLRLPRWQFADPIRSAVSQLFLDLGTTEPWALFLWLETPLGALDGRTPRVAIEQGDVERVQDIARGG